MASFAAQERSALHGIALPGRHGARDGAAGLLIEERTDVALRQRHRQARQALHAGQRGRIRRSASRCPTARAAPTRGAVTFAGTGPDQWIASAEGPEARASPRGCAGASACSRRCRTSPTRGWCCASAARACATCSPRACRSTCIRRSFKPGDVAIDARRLYRRADRHARRRDLPAHRAAQHGGQLLVLALGIGRRIRL